MQISLCVVKIERRTCCVKTQCSRKQLWHVFISVLRRVKGHKWREDVPTAMVWGIELYHPMKLSHAHENLVEQLRDKSMARLPWLWDKCLALPWMSYKPQEHNSCSARRTCLYRNTDIAVTKFGRGQLWDHQLKQLVGSVSSVNLHVFVVRRLWMFIRQINSDWCSKVCWLPAGYCRLSSTVVKQWDWQCFISYKLMLLERN